MLLYVLITIIFVYLLVGKIVVVTFSITNVNGTEAVLTAELMDPTSEEFMDLEQGICVSVSSNINYKILNLVWRNTSISDI